MFFFLVSKLDAALRQITSLRLTLLCGEGFTHQRIKSSKLDKNYLKSKEDQCALTLMGPRSPEPPGDLWGHVEAERVKNVGLQKKLL